MTLALNSLKLAFTLNIIQNQISVLISGLYYSLLLYHLFSPVVLGILCSRLNWNLIITIGHMANFGTQDGEGVRMLFRILNTHDHDHLYKNINTI